MEKFRHYKPQSSQFSIRKRKKYDVFLNFRGHDVRKTLVDHLHRSLSTAGVNVFLDSEELEKGKNIGMNLEQAIQNSTIYIPIFSPDYANSAWCLKELSLMWNIKSTSTYPIPMIPLFYNVEPCEVRYPDWRGPYAEAFSKHRTQGRHSPGEIARWRVALNEVSCLSGWSLKETSFGFEGKLVKQVVKDVLQTLDTGELDVARRPVGLIPRCEEVIQLLKLGGKTSDRLALGIWGMGGLGKTTLSKALYNEIHHLFEASCFVSNVKLEERIQGLRKLQQQILRDLLKTQSIKVNDIGHGKILMRNHLASLRALVVFDDVDDVGQLDALMGDCFAEGSRIIITTRDKRVLEVRKVDVIYPMRGLELAEGVELFSWHAFLRASPQEGYVSITERIVKACSGLPLSLEIIGTSLYDRNHFRYWIEALRKLENAGHNSVFNTLKISYDMLAPAEKHIFLDIACFFVNLKSIFIQKRAFNMNFYDRFWSALRCEPVYTNLKTLEEKALIVVHEHRYSEVGDEDIDEEDHAGQYFCEFSMHDQIRDMGRRIVVEESEKDPTKRSRLWKEEDIRTLMASGTLQENSNVEGLMWRRRMKLQHIDTLASMQKLEFLLWWKLQVTTEIKGLPTSLKYLVLSECQFKEYNPQMSVPSGVENGSDNNGLSAVSPVLPKSKAGIMKRLARSLKDLVLCNGQSKQYDPQMTGDVNESPVLSPVLPTFINGDVNESPVLSPVLPTSIAQLIYLRYLDMSGTKQTCLPKEVCELHCLEDLYLSRCSLKALPEAFGNLNKLKTLDVSNNFLSEFPPSFQHLESLVNLEMAWNEQLVIFPALPKRLITLNARRCSKLQVISSMYNMGSLKTMDLSHCKTLTQLPPLCFWESLRYLNLDGCKQLVKLDPLPRELASLRISGCSQLQKVSSLPVLYGGGGKFEPTVKPSFFEGLFDQGLFPHSLLRTSSETLRLCMTGCDNIRLNIYQLLMDFENLKQLDLSVSPAEELLGETQPLLGQMYRKVERDTSSVAVLFCFVFDSNENVRLPEMEVVMTLLDDDHEHSFSHTFKLPSLKKEYGSGKNILRVCVLNGWRTLRRCSSESFFEEGEMRCSYRVEDRSSKRETPVLLRQAEIFLLSSKDVISSEVSKFLKQWKLL